jgi:preprotein translocase subunit SecF
VGAVLAIAHDALIIVAFVAWSRMEFNTTTIAAILTILGYSINDTIVIFDRIRENQRI